MASPVDTSVKFYREDFPGAPTLNGVAGSLIGLLDACLCTGFGLRSATSLVVAGGVATLTLASDAKNGNLLHSVILVEGVTGALTALNGEQRVTVASSTTLSFTTAAADGTAAGTITVKTAPAGWEKKFSGTNKAVFKSLSPEANTSYLWVSDTGTTNANVRAYEAMTDVDTGTGAAPTVADLSTGGFWAKSIAADATVNRWDLFADARAFYYAPAAYSGVSPTAIGQGCYFFGDIVAYKSGDAFAVALFAASSAPGNSPHFGSVWVGAQPGSAARFLRAYTGLGSAVAAFSPPVSGTNGYSGAESTMGVFPAPTDGGLRVSAIQATEVATSGASSVLRGVLPGPYHVPQSGLASCFQRGNTVALGNKKLYVVYAGSSFSDTEANTYSGRGLIDITGPWR